MDRRSIIERLLEANRAGQWNMSSAFGGAMGVNSVPNVPLADMNKAIEAWLKNDEPAGIIQVTDTLHMIGILTEAEHKQIIEAIDPRR